MTQKNDNTQNCAIVAPTTAQTSDREIHYNILSTSYALR